MFVPENKIVREHKNLPNFEFWLAYFGVGVEIWDENLKVKVQLKDISLTDYYRKDTSRITASFNSNSQSNIRDGRAS